MRASVLTLRGLTKSFAGQVALRDVSFDLRAGEVHALLGANGSGKSTLVKCLAGVHEPDGVAARMEVDGARVELPLTPARARALGLVFIHQDLGLLHNLTVAENLALTRGFRTRRGSIDWPEEQRRARRVLDEHELDIDAGCEVRDLSAADRTLLAIARGLEDAEDGRVLVLDEPTASLPDAEAERLFVALDRSRARGLGVVFVSHRIQEIFRASDRVTVLEDGAVLGTWDTADLDESQLVGLLSGRSSAADEASSQRTQALEKPRERVRLLVRGLSGDHVRDVDLHVRAGEIVGVAGLAGSGRSELLRLLFGAQPIASGSVTLDGEPAEFRTPGEAVAAGVCLVPQDRHASGAFLGLPVADNLTLTSVDDLTSRGKLDATAHRELADQLIDEFDIRPAQRQPLMKSLSGGNQQKAVVAKWLHRSPRLVLLDEPVQGVDVAAKAEIYRHVRNAASGGAAVLVVDAEFENLAGRVHRILVIHDGRLVEELDGRSTDRHDVLRHVLLAQTADHARAGRGAA